MLNNFFINSIRKKYFSKYEEQFYNLVVLEIVERVRFLKKYKEIINKTNIFMYKIKNNFYQ